MSRLKIWSYLLMTLGCLASIVNVEAQKSPIRESIEWLDVWMPNTNDSALPRILLVGNSITRGYYPEVQKELAGKAYVARLTTSKSVGDPGLLSEISLILGYYQFDIVHFNNGLHGWGYTEQQYMAAFPAFVNTIRKHAPTAKLIWATTTPMRSNASIDAFDPKTERVRARNKIALDYINKQKDIGVDDLWELVINKPDFFEGGDGTHPNAAGYKALGKTVAAALAALLTAQKSK